MQYYIEIEGSVREIVTNESEIYHRMLEIAKNHPLYITDAKTYAKISMVPAGTISEIDVYNDIKNLHIAPKLLSQCKLFKAKKGTIYTNGKEFCDDEITVHLLLIERFGKSVAETYFPEPEYGPGPPATSILNDDIEFDALFPQHIVPVNIRLSIRQLLLKLLEKGWCHDDVHAGNFLVDENEIVKIIDFDCISKFNPEG
jgi:hypothetical protein